MHLKALVSNVRILFLDSKLKITNTADQKTKRNANLMYLIEIYQNEALLVKSHALVSTFHK